MDAQQPGRVGRWRLALLYALLALAVAGVLVYVISAGHSKRAEAQIAGGYQALAGTSCLGPQFELIQSGRFVSLSNTHSTLGGARVIEWVRR